MVSSNEKEKRETKTTFVLEAACIGYHICVALSPCSLQFDPLLWQPSRVGLGQFGAGTRCFLPRSIFGVVPLACSSGRALNNHSRRSCNWQTVKVPMDSAEPIGDQNQLKKLCPFLPCTGISETLFISHLERSFEVKQQIICSCGQHTNAFFYYLFYCLVLSLTSWHQIPK